MSEEDRVIFESLVRQRDALAREVYILDTVDRTTKAWGERAFVGIDPMDPDRKMKRRKLRHALSEVILEELALGAKGDIK